MPDDSTREELATYQYLMRQENLRLKNYWATLDERRRHASVSSARRAGLSIHSTGQTDPRHQFRTRRISERDRADLTHNLDLSFMTHDEEGIPIPKTATGALLSVATYLRTTQPPADDPNAALHR